MADVLKNPSKIKYAMKLLILSCIIFATFTVSAQPIDSTHADNCSKYMEIWSYFWKNDSLGTNGFRLQTFKWFLDCKMSKINKSFLVDKLGPPNSINMDRSGVYYLYYYYNGRAIPEKANLSLEKLSLVFFFKETNDYIEKISTEFLD
jgi:hypothetical protein